MAKTSNITAETKATLSAAADKVQAVRAELSAILDASDSLTAPERAALWSALDTLWHTRKAINSVAVGDPHTVEEIEKITSGR